jgi:putative serine protease PepD
MSDQNRKSKAIKIIAIVTAWITVVLFGVLMVWFTSLVGQSVTGAVSYEQPNFAGSIILNGLIGVLILVVILIADWRFRKKMYFFHLNIGLWIGVGIYALILLGGIISYYTNQNQPSESPLTSCTTAVDKYRQFGSAIVPIATDQGYGTGFIIDDKGTVLTANHVIKGSSEQYASYASGRVNMTIIDQAPEYDLAILRLDRFDKTYFPLSNSYSVGDQVAVYGYPGNTFSAGAPSLSGGIVSRILTTAALRLNDTATPDGFELIQTDAPINPGNSGGPLIGSCGVVGVVLAISDSAELSQYVGAVSEQGIGYVVSINAAAQRFKLPLSPNN